MTGKLTELLPVKGLPHAVEMDPEHPLYGWVFYQHPNGQWVSVRKATKSEMESLEE